MVEFWLSKPTILLKKSQITQIWPYENMDFNQKLNAVTRFVLLISLAGYAILSNYTILLMGLIFILGIVIIHTMYSNKMAKEAMTGADDESGVITEEISENHPMSNVLMTDYSDKPNRGPAKKYNTKVEDEINLQTKNSILEMNKENKDIGNIFNNLGDNLEFEKSMRQFYINPSTTIPNKQDDFKSFCYGDMYSEKPLIVY